MSQWFGRWLIMGSASSLEVVGAFFGAMKSTPGVIMSSCGLSVAPDDCRCVLRITEAVGWLAEGPQSLNPGQSPVIYEVVMSSESEQGLC
jgi:hypothetical protein